MQDIRRPLQHLSDHTLWAVVQRNVVGKLPLKAEVALQEELAIRRLAERRGAKRVN